MSLDRQEALDAVDEFIEVGNELARLPILADARYKAAAEDLYQITQRLLVANENMAGWLNRFLTFDFHRPDARHAFLELVREFHNKKTAPGGFSEMKWPCSDIEYIYIQRLESQFDDLLANSDRADEARKIFKKLSEADADMVAFIADTVVADIDAFVHDTEDRVNQSDLNGAEQRRLAFRVSSAALSERLVHYANGLSDLVIRYAHRAGRSVTLS